MTRDTVIADTPAARATSSMVMAPRRRRLGGLVMAPLLTVRTLWSGRRRCNALTPAWHSAYGSATKNEKCEARMTGKTTRRTGRAWLIAATALAALAGAA